MLLSHGLRAINTPVQISFSTTTILSRDTTESSSTFTNVNFGTAYPDRYAIVFYAHTSGQDTQLSSATIGGITATILSNAYESISTGSASGAIIGAYLPTGTTATVVLNYNTSGNANCILPMALTGVRRKIDSATFTTNTESVASVTNDDIRNGITLGVAGNGANYTYTWSGLTELVDTNYTGGGTSRRISVATLNPTATSLNKTISATKTASDGRAFLAVVSLR